MPSRRVHLVRVSIWPTRSLTALLKNTAIDILLDKKKGSLYIEQLAILTTPYGIIIDLKYQEMDTIILLIATVSP